MKMKFKITSSIILIVLFIGLIEVPNLSAVDSYNFDLGKKISENTDILDNSDTYRLCYVESGDVDHDQHSFYTIGFFQGGPPGFGIGRVGLDLKGWHDDTRLTVKSVFGIKTYDYDVHIEIRGFIGCAWPTVSIYGGILKGYALIVKISPIY